MSLTREQKEQLAEPVVQHYLELEEELMRNVIGHLQNIEDVTQQNVSVWQLKQMEILGLLNEKNLKTIQKYASLTNAEMNKALYDAGVTSVAINDEALSAITKLGAALVIPPAISATPVLLSTLQGFVAQAASTLNLTNMTLLSSANQMYTNVVNSVAASVVTGTRTIHQAIRQVVNQWSEVGLPALIDKAGRKHSVEGYMRMVMTTTLGNTANKMQDERLEQWGISLVEVSSHVGARPLCEPYQGKIFTTGNDKGYKHLYNDTSYGEAAGLFGINCGHNKYPYVPGYSTQRYYPYPKAENDRVYAESQQQRLLERNIRKAKTRKGMYEMLGDVQGVKSANQLLLKRQEKMREFIAETGRTRRRDREQIM